ncbi:dynactin subunit 6-like [Agrilus planipennis]|uniref:Dynactin subunit 6 n=1 Tax=Agrilus planipennis TaxID=224129 RepID=A0A1W4XN15_AGRPL|nr:dynactin subunit 6 [Agrilus planipennis]XP_025832854.1 dynactin subunit 6-like [Agrilus planipennis]
MSKGIKIVSGAIVCEECKLRGDVTIGGGTIIHPSASIIAEAGPIIIGENCLIEEQTKIINKAPVGQIDNENVQELIIGSNNVFEVDCAIEAIKIGDNNVFESKSFVGNKVTITNGCIIGAGCRLTEEQTLKENTIIYGENCNMREGLDRPLPQTLQMDTLIRMLPNYHHLKKPNLVNNKKN